MDYNATQFLADVRLVVDYNWADEMSDYEQSGLMGDNTDGHVFEVLQRLDDFLTGADE